MSLVSRRDVSSLLFKSALAIGVGARVASSDTAVAQTGASAAMTSEKWMSAWMSAERPVFGALLVQRFKDPWYIVLKPITWLPGEKSKGLPAVTVPRGFTTDLASIPSLFWQLLRPDGEYAYPAIIHDYLYWTQSVKRETADQIFDLAMEDFKIDMMSRTAIYRAVRLGGESPWQQNAALKADGGKRVLKRFPEDPLVTWEAWKREPDVFGDH